MAELPIATQCGAGAPAGPPLDSGPGSESGTCFHSNRSMPAGAGTPRYENEAWSLEVFGCGWCHPFPLDSRFRENDEFGGRG